MWFDLYKNVSRTNKIILQQMFFLSGQILVNQGAFMLRLFEDGHLLVHLEIHSKWCNLKNAATLLPLKYIVLLFP